MQKRDQQVRRRWNEEGNLEWKECVTTFADGQKLIIAEYPLATGVFEVKREVIVYTKNAQLWKHEVRNGRGNLLKRTIDVTLGIPWTGPTLFERFPDGTFIKQFTNASSQYHRLDGPALSQTCLHSDRGRYEYYIEGEQYFDQETYLAAVRKYLRDHPDESSSLVPDPFVKPVVRIEYNGKITEFEMKGETEDYELSEILGSNSRIKITKLS